MELFGSFEKKTSVEQQKTYTCKPIKDKLRWLKTEDVYQNFVALFL